MSTLSSMLSSWPVICVLLAGSASVIFMFLHRAARLVPEPWYVSENVLGTFLAPVVVILLAAAAGAGVEAVGVFQESGAGALHLPAAGLLALLFAGIVVLLHRMTPRAEETPQSDRIIPMPQPTNGPQAPTDEPPRPLPVDRAA